MMFSEPEAAIHYSVREPDHEPSLILSHVWQVSQLHAIYSYDAETNEEYIDIKPTGSDLHVQADTRIVLPAVGTPHCDQEVHGRCLLAADDLRYPPAAYGGKASGSVTLTGTITRDGGIVAVLVAGADADASWRDSISMEATQNLKTWRFEPAPSEDPIRITYSYTIVPSLGRGRIEIEFALPSQVTLRASPIPF
jgi:hypothetical protein